MSRPQQASEPHSIPAPFQGAAPRFGVLGPLLLRNADGTAVEPGTPKLRTVLALLLLDANQVVSRDRLRAALWGENEPPRRPPRSTTRWFSCVGCSVTAPG